MKKIIAVAIVAALSMTMFSCGLGGSKPKTEADSLAYYVGVNLRQYIYNIDSTLNIDMLAAGLKDAMAIKKMEDVQNKGQEAYDFLNEYMTVRMPLRNAAESKAFLDKVEKSTKGIQKTESGILYVIENPGSDVKPVNNNDQVRVVYHGTMPTGQVFDSSRERGDTTQLYLNQVIAGWTEGMKLIGEGGKIKMWIPSELAYGPRGNGMIGANQAIVFEVDLVQVIPTPAME